MGGLVRPLLVALLAVSAVQAQGVSYPRKPDGQTNWIVDAADLIDARDALRINDIARELLAQKQIPILVVTIPALARYGAEGESVSGYARLLFDSWGIGSQAHNYGMLLLVSQGDRKARIELGAAWGRSYNVDANHVMSQLIIPRFKEEEFSRGILDGVRGMDAMARGESIPGPRRPGWWWPLWIGLAGLVVAVGASLKMQGVDGIGYLVLNGLGSIVLLVLFVAVSGAGAGGGSGGGSFGGGSSGGGGATGSW